MSYFSVILLTEYEKYVAVCQENELCVWHIEEVAFYNSAYDETEEMQIENEPELLGKVAHRGDVTDLLVSCTYLYISLTSLHAAVILSY